MLTQFKNGSLAQLSSYFKKENPTVSDLTLKLFTNNITVTDTLVAADFVEAAGGGYAPKTLLAENWNIALDTDGVPTASYPDQTFEFTGALTDELPIYGAYLVDANGVAVLGEKKTLVFTPELEGDLLLVRLKYHLTNKSA